MSDYSKRIRAPTPPKIKRPAARRDEEEDENEQDEDDSFTPLEFSEDESVPFWFWNDKNIGIPPALKSKLFQRTKKQKVYLSFDIDLSKEACGWDGWLLKGSPIRINGKKVEYYNKTIEGDKEDRRSWRDEDIDVTDLIPPSTSPKKVTVEVKYDNPIIPPFIGNRFECLKIPWSRGKLSLWLTVRVPQKELSVCDCEIPNPDENKRCRNCGGQVRRPEVQPLNKKKFCYACQAPLDRDGYCTGKEKHPNNIPFSTTITCVNPDCKQPIPSFSKFCWYCGTEQAGGASV